MEALSVRAVGMVSSVGNGALECAASVRAGLARYGDTSVMTRGLAPLRMALVPDDALPTLEAYDDAPRSARHRRSLRLAAAAVGEVLEAVALRGAPCLVVSDLPDDAAAMLADDLAGAFGESFDGAASRGLRAGAAGVYVALLDAAHRIARGEASAVLVVAAGTRLDLAALDDLQRARRLLADDAMEGFIPGEGAAALCVTAASGDALATITHVGVASDPFTPAGDEPMTAAGLTRAVQAALPDDASPARSLWLGLNGESWNAREWGVAARRCHGLIAEGAAVRHPVECFGDPEAALGAMQLALAATFLRRGWSEGPALVWNFSDDGLRGAARLVAPGAR